MQLTKTTIWHRIKARLLLILPISRYDRLANFRCLDEKVRKIRCITAAGIGDTIMAAPAISALKARFPDASLAVLGHYNREVDKICQLMPAVDEVIDIGIPKYTWLLLFYYLLSKFLTLSYKLRKRRYDLVVSFIPNPIRKLFLLTIATKYWIYGNTANGFPVQHFRTSNAHKIPGSSLTSMPTYF